MQDKFDEIQEHFVAISLLMDGVINKNNEMHIIEAGLKIIETQSWLFLARGCTHGN